MNRHTPGPWRTERNASTHSVYPYRIRRPNEDGTAREVGECWHKEDARLIAAAPEMRETLETTDITLTNILQLAGERQLSDGYRVKVLVARDRIRALLARIDNGGGEP